MQASVPGTSGGISLFLIEFGLVLVAFALAFCTGPTRPAFLFQLERWCSRWARRRALSVLFVGLLAAGLRLLFLPVIPIPLPFLTSDFSFLLAADTFASGRFTNPTPPAWIHLETLHVSFLPTYMSMYFPAQGLLLAAGQFVAGHPWWGVWISVAVMCAAICWMLQAWLPPGWALLGGVLAVFRLGLFSYWEDSYSGGALPAIGGALVFGALPRILHRFRTRDFFWLAAGMALLFNSRPYEGALICAPALLVLFGYLLGRSRPDRSSRPSALERALEWLLGPRFRSPRPPVRVLLPRLVPAILILSLGVGFLGYYNHRVFGHALTLPYTLNRATYAVAPHFLWQSPHPEPLYRHQEMRKFYTGWELDGYRKARSPGGLLKSTVHKALIAESFYLGFALALPLLAFGYAVRDRRIRLLLITAAIFSAGLAIETWLLPHYVAALTSVIYAVVLQCLRHLRAWRPGGRFPGLFLVRAVPAICLFLVCLRLYAQPLHLALPGETFCGKAWFGTYPRGLARAHVAQEIASHPGPQLALVRYSPAHDPVIEWVYNASDIDRSKIVWANDMDAAENQQLLRYFQGRQAWLVEPDAQPPRVTEYPSVTETPRERTTNSAK